MSRPSFAELIRHVTAHGGTVEDDSAGEWRTYWLIAPEGQMWACAKQVGLLVQWDSPNAKLEAVADALERVKLGLESSPVVEPRR